MRLLPLLAPRPLDAPWELAAESVAVKIRWVGLVVGFAIANLGPDPIDRLALDAMLGLGLVFTAIDTAAYRLGRVFLRDFPLAISALEALFIGLLCLAHAGPDSPFRFYYLLSLTCCAVRYSPRTTFATCGLDVLSYAALTLLSPAETRDWHQFALTLVILGWVAWAAGAMARWLARAGEDLRGLNAALRENQTQLETRIADRTRELEASQAQVLHQEKMAAFGLLAAGIAHEVGNPLAAISGIVQVLERGDLDPGTRDKLRLVTGELTRIQVILRELVQFSRPASGHRGPVAVADVVAEALKIAKFYQGGGSRKIVATVEPGVPPLVGVRDEFVQVVFNLVLNAIDATAKGGTIEVAAGCAAGRVVLTVTDDGAGVAPDHVGRLFKPYFTTKKHGTGLGLFVTRRIAEAHGGTVAVGAGPAGGARFTVTFPAPAGVVARPDRPAVGPAFGS